MGRVTIGNLLDDYEDDKIDIITGVQAYDIEIVPRKIVERILERCQEEIDSYTLEDICCSNSDHHYANGKLDMAYQVRDYAKRLLAKFEEDNE